jgi:hypothetical protein
MKPEKQINLRIVSVENGYVISEESYGNSLYEARRWVADTREGLALLVKYLCGAKEGQL